MGKYQIICEFIDAKKQKVEISFMSGMDFLYKYNYNTADNLSKGIEICINAFINEMKNDQRLKVNINDINYLKKEVESELKALLKIEDEQKEKTHTNNKAKINCAKIISNNEFEVSSKCLNKYLEKVRSGTDVIAINQRERFDFISKDGTNYCAKIDNVSVVSLKERSKIRDIEFENNNIICGFIDKQSEKIIIFTLGSIRESTNKPELKYYQFDIPEIIPTNIPMQLVFLYDIESSKEVFKTNCECVDFLMPFYEYFQSMYDDLIGYNDNRKMNIDLHILHNYYDILKQATKLEGSFIIPIIGEPFKLTEVQFICYTDGLDKKFKNFYETEVYPLKEEDIQDLRKDFEDRNIILSNDVSFIRFNFSNLDEKSKRMIDSLLLDDAYHKIEINYNISGEIIKIKRVLYGIEQCLKGDILNKDLVNLICSEDIDSAIIEKLKNNKYIPNEDYLNSLREKYWMLKGNEEQLRAIDKIVQMRNNNCDLMLIQGPPGTGKTELILSLIKELYNNKQTVLVTSNVQVACDNVVDRLKNFKNIPLKRYSAIKGDIYKEEILENEQKYIENQILAGFSLTLKGDVKTNIILNNQEQYDSLGSLENKIKSKINKINFEKESYYNKIKKYDDLKKSLNDDTNNYKKLSKEADSYKKELIKVNNFIDSESKKISLLNTNLLEYQTKIKVLQDEKVHLEIEKSSLEDKINFYNNENVKLTNNVNELKINKVQIEKDIKSKTNELKIYDVIDESLINDEINYYLENNKLDIKNNSSKDLIINLFKDITPIIDFGLLIKNLIKDDKEFIEQGKDLKLPIFESIYYNLKNSNYTKILFDNDIVSIMNIVNEYYKNKPRKLRIFKNKKNKQNEYYDSNSKFKDKLKEFYYTFNFLITNKIKSHLKLDDIINQKNKLENKLLDLNNELSSIEEQIKNESNNSNKGKDTIVTDINADKDQLNTIIDQLNKIENELLTYNQQLTIINNELDDLNKKLPNKKKEQEELTKHYDSVNESISLIKNKINNYDNDVVEFYNKNQDLIDEYDYFIYSKDIVINRFNKYLTEIETIRQNYDEQVLKLKESGWNDKESRDLLFNYVSDLNDIKNIELNKDSSKFENYVTGIDSTFKDLFELDDISNGSVVSMTTNQVASLLNSQDTDKVTFDYAIIDEASKCTFEDIIISLPRVKHLVLIGDFMQLDKIFTDYNMLEKDFQNKYSELFWYRLNQSTFYQFLRSFVDYNKERGLSSFDYNPMVSVMKKQYRMNKGIFELVKPIYEIHKEFELVDQKQSTYNDLLCIQINDDEMDENKNQEGKRPVIYNQKEAYTICNILETISENRDKYPGIQKIGIITGYKGQERLIIRNLKQFDNISGLEIGTFDRFQGREFDLVIISMVRTRSLGFLSNLRRMNVAISRAKNHLIVLGNFDKLMKRKYESDEINGDKEIEMIEKEFVPKTLLPLLNSNKKEFESRDEMNKEIIKFLKEEDDDE